MVRQYDHENFLWIIQLPKKLRAYILALRAFNLETLLIGENVKSKEPVMIQIRFQWWRDAIQSISSSHPVPHPVLTALWFVNQHRKLNRYHLKRILDTRESDLLDNQPPLTMTDLEQYAEGTASQLLYLQLAAAGEGSR
eukprot:jgi/Chrzof1/4390/Cz14g11110.t1